MLESVAGIRGRQGCYQTFGLAIARVSLSFELELIKFGVRGDRDPNVMLKFRVAFHPRYTSSWMILNLLLLSVHLLL